MKKCIVLSGQYRTFDQTCENIKKFIEVNEADVYYHTWSTDANEISKLNQYLNPRSMISEDFSSYENQFIEMEKRIRQANPKPAPNDKVAGNASMNYSRKKAFELVDRKYDALIYCRFDIGFGYIFKFENVDKIYTPTEESYNLISDIFALMPFESAKNYFLYDEYERLHSTQFEPVFEDYLNYRKNYGSENIRIHKYERYCPHMMLLRNLIMTNTDFASINLPVYIQR